MLIRLQRDLLIKGEHCAIGSEVEVSKDLAQYLFGNGSAINPAVSETETAVPDQSPTAINPETTTAETAVVVDKKVKA